ncbi:poly(R)-hydroxyalkanoic acid synthase subunit PhaE [Marinobacterium arenosum]|uniref:poly(R)-hydroxyalkanoic acid synthase subunit PhaE n=1 Tax=Marinobacterium arenosum TaxID=2862496 RepID=UPI001C979015|nr:poly(R)-hydroxyalkanoic acid synthase subunit PhaE [Marinobacterium arenosum]MBY4675157.1 hypothetical protein [Marinobacterium arenosum]
MADNLNEQMERWLEAQKAFWQALQSNTSVQRPEDWAAFVSRYQRAFGDALPGNLNQLLSLLSAQANQFTRFGEQLLRQLQRGDTPAIKETVAAFSQYMQQQSAELLTKRWQLPEQFGALFKSHSFRDDLLLDNPFIHGLNSLLDSPAVGANHQLQQDLRETSRLLSEYQQALRDYIQHYDQIGQTACQRLLEGLADCEPPIDSLNELHELWVACYESAYSDTAFSDDYQRAHGRISNALMKLRQHAHQVRDRHLESAGMVSRQSIDSLAHQQHQLRKQVRRQARELTELRQQLARQQANPWQPLIDTLRDEVKALREELTQLRHSGDKE